MLGNLPVELLREIIEYIHQPSHLQALCLVSKTVSSIATQFLYRDLVLDFRCYNEDTKTLTAVSMCDGLKFVKTFEIGPLGGLSIGPLMRKILALFDHLISRLQDHSLLDFKWDACYPPLDSQLTYIWEHQWNIQSIDLSRLTYAVQLAQLRKDLKFPQKYVDITLPTPLDDRFLAKLDLSCMRSLTVKSSPRTNEFSSCISSCISAHIDFITKLQLYNICFWETDIQLDQLTSLVSLGMYNCPGISLILSNFTNPKLKEYCVEVDLSLGEYGPDNDLMVPFYFITTFQGLETLVVNVPYQTEYYPSLLKDLTDGISLAHNGTLRYLALINNLHWQHWAQDCRDSEYDALMADTVMACSHLVQLELHIGWGREGIYLQRITNNLPSLKILCLQIDIPGGHFPAISMDYPNQKTWAKGIIREVASSLMLSIADNSCKLRLLRLDISRYPEKLCFPRGLSHGSLRFQFNGPLEILEHHVKYHFPEYHRLPACTFRGCM